MTKAKLLDLLEITKIETIRCFDLIPSDLEKKYGVGKWNVKQILNHLADAETVLYQRIRRVISIPNQTVYGFDQDAWEQKLNYIDFPLTINKNIYSSVRESIIYLVEKHYDIHKDNKFIHNETGIRTLKDEFEKVGLHNESHLKQIALALKPK